MKHPPSHLVGTALRDGALPPGPFKLILADPAWKWQSYDGKKAVPTQGADPYPTMGLEELKALPVADVAAPDALLAMWVVGSHIRQAFDLAEAWGFEFCTDLFYWFKRLGSSPGEHEDLETEYHLRVGMGKHSRKQVEPCFLFKRGRGLPVLCHSVRQVIITCPGRHSEKPAEQYERLERLYGDVPRLEMFARKRRAGWSAWGNEVAA